MDWPDLKIPPLNLWNIGKYEVRDMKIDDIWINSESQRIDAIKKITEFEQGDYVVSFRKVKDKRTEQQNRALHKYFDLLANELNESGQEIKKVLSRNEVEIPWCKATIKELMWRPIQQIMLEKTSTSDANKVEYSKVYEVLNRFTSERLGVSIRWPSKD